MKKGAVIAILFLFLSVGSSAQGFYSGVKAGLNFSTLTRTSFAYGRTRANVGAFGGFQFSSVVALQLEAIYSFQGAKVTGAKLNLDYLKIPIMAKIYLIRGLNVECGVSFNILTSALINGSAAKGYNGFDFSVPVGLAYQIGKHFEVGARYDISFAKYHPTQTGSNSLWSINLSYRF